LASTFSGSATSAALFNAAERRSVGRRGRVWPREWMSVDRIQQESAIARDFILPARRDRFLELASTRGIKPDGKPSPRELKRRRKYCQMMANLEHWFDPRCKQLSITANDQHSAARSRLGKLGASADAFVMSEDRKIDGRILDLEEVLLYLARNDTYGTLVAWSEHGVAYYEQSELAALTRVLLAQGR
jgi:hypothetical protein